MIESKQGLPVIYARPPVVEAVVALHLSGTLERKSMQAFARKQKIRFPNQENIVQVQLKIDRSTAESFSQSSNQQSVGLKLVSKAGNFIIVLNPGQFAVSNLAPYLGWDMLITETRSLWEGMHKIQDRILVQRLSTRFINRIDVPIEDGKSIDIADYFQIGLSLPKIFDTMGLANFVVNCVVQNPEYRLTHSLQFYALPVSPLIDHLSVVIDIDTFTSDVIPMRQDEMWEVMSHLREAKNQIFESCITDKARDLFK